MKEEEMAEEYIKDNCIRWECDSLPVDDIAKENFLAGLKAGRPQWHDLRKNPNDLPKDKHDVWCDYSDGYGEGFYDKDEGSWLIEGHLYCSIIDAWCEEPTFDKE